jgi:Arc/MetJ-type ribon-helix-helix transcriptional regulator
VTVELSSEQEQIIREQIASGLFGSIEEVLDSALTRLAISNRSLRSAWARSRLTGDPLDAYWPLASGLTRATSSFKN